MTTRNRPVLPVGVPYAAPAMISKFEALAAAPWSRILHPFREFLHLETFCASRHGVPSGRSIQPSPHVSRQARWVDGRPPRSGLKGYSKPETLHGLTDWTIHCFTTLGRIAMTLDARHDFDACTADASYGDAVTDRDSGRAPCLDRKRPARGASPARPRAPGLSTAALRRVNEFLDGHIGDHFRLQDVADAACMSQFHFTRLFKESLQQSPMRYVLEKRVELAKQELALGGKRIAVIACDLGFCDQSHFARSFRRFTGVSPSVFAGMKAQERDRADFDSMA